MGKAAGPFVVSSYLLFHGDGLEEGSAAPPESICSQLSFHYAVPVWNRFWEDPATGASLVFLFQLSVHESSIFCSYRPACHLFLYVYSDLAGDFHLADASCPEDFGPVVLCAGFPDPSGSYFTAGGPVRMHLLIICYKWITPLLADERPATPDFFGGLLISYGGLFAWAYSPSGALYP